MTPRRWLVGGFDRGVAAAMRHLPTPAGQALAGAIARHVAPRLYPRLDAMARAAVPRLRPDLAPDAAVAALWDATTRTACEVPCYIRLHDEGRVTMRGEAALLALHRDRRPVILAGLHLGNWEILGLAAHRLDIPVAVVHDPPPAAEFRGQLLVRERLRAGARLLPLGREATWPALRAVREGREILYMLVDEVTEGRVMAPRLGRAAPLGGNLVQAVKLARLAGAAILPAYALRLPGPAGDPRFEACFLPPIEVPRTADRAADVAAGTAALDAAITPAVLRHLEQWFPLLYWR
ncbi:lysophospholipid acyltransferase family protein [Roseicella frigidaeris]|uniref:Lauroyl acyltransferase n=1 Tax=Roseicella frigidaeris TaxID=2230885 RepID=A0A327MAX8_9PROT|nr:lysophospholipid acyltransferase family protein [Roseicella frigidaeris]RAI59625.1 hypothetical protein DOO78_08520 [Roseicella frigidaeris]